MNTKMKVRGAIAATGTAAAVALTLGFGAPAVAAPTDEFFAVNSGSITLDFGPEVAGETINVTSQVPGEVDGVYTVSADIDENGSVTLANFAGPAWVSVTLGSGEEAEELPIGWGDDEANIAEPTVSILRNGASMYLFDPETNTFGGTGGSDSPVPALSDLDYMVAVADFNFSPTEYEQGVAFTLSFTDGTNVFDGAAVNTVASAYIYDDETGEQLAVNIEVVDGAFQLLVPAEYTTAPHTLIVLDEFGRALTGVTLDGGVAVEDDPAGSDEPELAATGANDAGLALGLGAGLLALGAAVFVIARARATAAE